MNIADVDPVYGLQLTHPRFLEFLGAPESARLFNGSPGHWVRMMDREDAVAAALQLQHDAGVMTSNLQVLDQFFMSLSRVSSEILRLAIGPVVFPSTTMDVLSPVPMPLGLLTRSGSDGYSTPCQVYLPDIPVCPVHIPDILLQGIRWFYSMSGKIT